MIYWSKKYSDGYGTGIASGDGYLLGAESYVIDGEAVGTSTELYTSFDFFLLEADEDVIIERLI